MSYPLKIVCPACAGTDIQARGQQAECRSCGHQWQLPRRRRIMRAGAKEGRGDE
jgi:hypothetical protein